MVQDVSAAKINATLGGTDLQRGSGWVIRYITSSRTEVWTRVTMPVSDVDVPPGPCRRKTLRGPQTCRLPHLGDRYPEIYSSRC